MIVATVVVVAASIGWATPATAESGVSNGINYTVTTTVLDGSTPDGMARWRADIVPTRRRRSGGRRRVQQRRPRLGSRADRQVPVIQVGEMEFDLRSNRSGDLSQHRDRTTDSHRHRLVGSASAELGQHGRDRHAHRPADHAGRPLRQRAGRANRLSDQAKVLIADQYGELPTEILDRGTAPVTENFADWIPTAAGMEIHFEEYQFDGPPFARVITVPWPALTDVLAPDMSGLAQG